jgi:predicted acetyltransferase
MPALEEIESVVVNVVDSHSRVTVENLLQLYIHDLSEHRGSVPMADGRYAMAERRSIYFTDSNCRAYVFTCGDRPVGFAMVSGLLQPPRCVGEFFVVRAARRLGVGRDAALQVFARHPGHWEWAFQEANVGAARFWRLIATELVGDKRVESHRPVPNKPWVPDDVWISLDTVGVD